jgi:hypothetical protein
MCLHGCVADNVIGIVVHAISCSRSTRERHSKHIGDTECRLFSAVSFFNATDLTFEEYFHHFISPAQVRHAVSNKKKPMPGLTTL